MDEARLRECQVNEPGERKVRWRFIDDARRAGRAGFNPIKIAGPIWRHSSAVSVGSRSTSRHLACCCHLLANLKPSPISRRPSGAFAAVPGMSVLVDIL
jgi:hypothetical protein